MHVQQALVKLPLRGHDPGLIANTWFFLNYCSGSVKYSVGRYIMRPAGKHCVKACGSNEQNMV